MNEDFLNDLNKLYQEIRNLEGFEDMSFNDWDVELDNLQEILYNVDSWYDRNFNRFIEDIDIDIENVDPLVTQCLKVFLNEFSPYHNIDIKNDISMNSIIVDIVDLDNAIIDILDIFNY